MMAQTLSRGVLRCAETSETVAYYFGELPRVTMSLEGQAALQGLSRQQAFGSRGNDLPNAVYQPWEIMGNGFHRFH